MFLTDISYMIRLAKSFARAAYAQSQATPENAPFYCIISIEF